jgi:hypothetical protein
MKNRKLKILMSMLCLLPFTLFAQEELVIDAGHQTFQQAFDSLTTGLISSRIPYGVLLDRTFASFASATCRANRKPHKGDLCDFKI